MSNTKLCIATSFISCVCPVSSGPLRGGAASVSDPVMAATSSLDILMHRQSGYAVPSNEHERKIAVTPLVAV